MNRSVNKTEYLSILEKKRGKEGREGAEVDWRRRNCGRDGVMATSAKRLTHISQIGCILASREGNPITKEKGPAHFRSIKEQDGSHVCV